MGKLDEELKRVAKTSRQFLPFFKFPVGKTDMRILPASKDDDSDNWFLRVGFHYNLNEKQPIVCRYETNAMWEPCPVCAAVTELRAAGQNDEAQKISARRQYIVRAIIRGQEEKGAQMVRLATTVFQAIGSIIQEKETFGDVLNPNPKGRDIRVIKSGTGLSTEYVVQALPKTGPALPTPSEMKAVMDKLTPIINLVDIPTEKEVAMMVRAKLGFTVGGTTASAAVSIGGDEDDDDWNTSTVSKPEEENSGEGENESWGDEENDVPFHESESDETEVDAAPVSDDSWLDDDDNDDDDDLEEAKATYDAKLQAARQAPKTQVTELTAGLSKALDKSETETQQVLKRKKGKSRQRSEAESVT